MAFLISYQDKILTISLVSKALVVVYVCIKSFFFLSKQSFVIVFLRTHTKNNKTYIAGRVTKCDMYTNT